MIQSNFVYIVCFFGMPVAAFQTINAAELWRTRNFLKVAYKEGNLLHLLSYRQAPESSIMRVAYDKTEDGFVFSNSVSIMRYSRNALDKASSLFIDEDLPE